MLVVQRLVESLKPNVLFLHEIMIEGDNVVCEGVKEASRRLEIMLY